MADPGTPVATEDPGTQAATADPGTQAATADPGTQAATAEFSGELHEGEIPPAKGEGAGCELHRREGESVHLSGGLFCHGAAWGLQERGDEEYNKQGI